MNEFDTRQLNIMMQKIHSFNAGHLHLSDLIYDLEALLNILTDPNQYWNDLFKGYWWDLEQIYATALDNEKLHLDTEDQKNIEETINNLKKLIEDRLNSTI